jgi:hypothetical protein
MARVTVQRCSESEDVRMSLRHGGLVLVVSSAVLALASGSLVAAADSPIKPKQHFTASVNGSRGLSHPVTIRMACFGPIRPGQTGHPMGGQTVAVTRVRAGTNGAGYPGDRGTSIGAFFGAPPPSASSSSSYVRFTEYGSKPIPTSLELPCSGSGRVSFVPLPVDPTSHDVTVAVTFVGQP